MSIANSVAHTFVATAADDARVAKSFSKQQNFSGEIFSGRDRMLLASDLLPPCDFFAVLIAAYVSSLCASIFATATAPSWIHLGNVALLGASLATYVLYDKNFATAASQCN